MDSAALEKRQRIMSRSIKLGHCVCDPNKPCPCPLFKEKNICECAGEREEIASGEIKLTKHVRAVGCASKVPKKYLESVISGLQGYSDPRVIIGTESSDDAGVIALAGNKNASVMTVDVFAPSVDDPYTFGMIAAANSLSDVYAMGGSAETALSIIGFPIYSLPETAMKAMLQGGADKLAEAGVRAIGGHSINDSEIKCGYAVLGSIDPERIIANTGAKTGDLLLLTKPIGGGIVLFGQQINQTAEDEVTEVIGAMTTLNRIAGEAMPDFSVHAATDVTGFSLLGHLVEMARGSNKKITLNFNKVPLFSAVERLARLDAFPGAVERNREASEDFIDYGELTEAEQNILYSPETSGGLLIAIAPEERERYTGYLKDNGINAICIGEVADDSTAGKVELFGSRSITGKKQNPAAKPQAAAASCCCSTANPKPAEVEQRPQTTSDCCCTPEPAPAEESCCCSAAADNKADQSNELPAPANTIEFSSYMGAVNKAGSIPEKDKKLIALALSVSHKCGECIKINTAAARKFGASNAEISEAVALGISFGGASSNMFYNELRKER